MSPASQTTTRTRQAKALLAGGLVLGVGAAVTLATWTDEAYVEATFGTSSFNVQVRTEESAGWVEGPADAPARLEFAMPLAERLTPGDTVYAPVSLRTDETSVAGSVTLAGADPLGSPTAGEQALFEALTYRVVTLPDGASCGPDAVSAASPDAVLVDGGLTAGSPAGAVELGAQGAAPVDLCFAVTLPREAGAGTALQNQQVTPVWELAAVSADPAD